MSNLASRAALGAATGVAGTGAISISTTATASGIQVTATVMGASTAAVSLSTVILATGGAAALLLVGYGFFRLCTDD